MYKLYVRDAYLNRVAEIDDYQSLTLMMKYNDVSKWVLTLPTNSIAAREILKYQAGIVVVRDGITIFSGPVAVRSRTWNEEGDTLQVEGYDDTVWLERRVGYANPSEHPSGANNTFFPFFPLRFPSTEPTVYDIRKGKAETIMKEFVYYNFGPGALPERRVSGLTVQEDLKRGKTVTGKGRFQPVLDMQKSLALSGGDLGFRVVQVGKSLEFQVYDPTDKTQTAIFSPLLNNLKGFEYSIEDSETNYVIVGGDGEGKSRLFIEGGSSSIAKYGRFESFLDKGDSADVEELQQAIDEELAEKAEKMSLSIYPIDTEQLAFGRDYGLGDKVSIVITQPNELITYEDIHYFISEYQTITVQTKRMKEIQEKIEVISDVVREISISITPDGEEIIPTIGTPESLSRKVPKIFRDIKNLKKRISKWERR